MNVPTAIHDTQRGHPVSGASDDSLTCGSSAPAAPWRWKPSLWIRHPREHKSGWKPWLRRSCAPAAPGCGIERRPTGRGDSAGWRGAGRTAALPSGEPQPAERVGAAEHEVALLWLSRQRRPRPLEAAWLRRLHREMFGQGWRWAGQYRNSDKSIGADWRQIRIQVPALQADIANQVEHRVEPVDQISVRFHHRLVSIQPFPNGNGRHARLIADVLIVRLGAPLRSAERLPVRGRCGNSFQGAFIPFISHRCSGPRLAEVHCRAAHLLTQKCTCTDRMKVVPKATSPSPAALF